MQLHQRLQRFQMQLLGLWTCWNIDECACPMETWGQRMQSGTTLVKTAARYINASTRQIVTMSQLVKVTYRYLLQGTYFAFPNLVFIFNTTSTKKRLQASEQLVLPTDL